MLKQYCVCQLLWLNHQTYRIWFRQVVSVRVGQSPLLIIGSDVELTENATVTWSYNYAECSRSKIMDGALQPWEIIFAYLLFILFFCVHWTHQKFTREHDVENERRRNDSSCSGRQQCNKNLLHFLLWKDHSLMITVFSAKLSNYVNISQQTLTYTLVNWTPLCYRNTLLICV